MINIIDILICVSVVISFVYLIISIWRYRHELKEKEKAVFLNRFDKPIGIDSHPELNDQIRGSVRLYYSMGLTKDELKNKYKELP